MGSIPTASTNNSAVNHRTIRGGIVVWVAYSPKRSNLRICRSVGPGIAELQLGTVIFGFHIAGSQEVPVIRVEYAVLTAGDVNEDPMRFHTGFVARPGRYAHGLVAHRMSWCCCA